MKYMCKCGKEYEVSEEKGKWTYFVQCECGGKAESPEKPIRTHPLTNV